MASPSREQFRDWVIRHVGERFPLVKVARGSQPFSVRVNGHVASLENIYRIGTLRPDEVEHNVDRWVVELLRAAEGRPEDDGPFEAVVDRILPMILAGEASSETGTVCQPLVPGLHVAYAIDGDRTISYLPVTKFKQWAIDIDQLHEAAIRNLQNRSRSMDLQAAKDEAGNVRLAMLQTLDGYDASRILLPDLHERLKGLLGSPFVAAVPNRDILLCFRNEPPTIDQLRPQIQADYRSMPHQITDQLLLVTADGLAPMA